MATARYRRAGSELAPRDVILDALDVAHPDLTAPVRVVRDTVAHIIGGHRYAPIPFAARLVEDSAGEAPQAEIAIDHVGETLTQWIERSNGGVGATVRIMQVLAATGAVEWEVTLDVLGVSLDQRSVRVRLGYDPLLNRAAVAVRYDPSHWPGLF